MSSKNRILSVLYKYKHAWVFLYSFIYLPWFHWLERRTNVTFFIIHSPMDNLIPFCEYFVIPYFLWFFFIGFTGLYLFFKDVDGFYKYAITTITGMTLFLLFCTVFPNAILLRPIGILRDNICMDLVRYLWTIDTPTNVLPSLHVYNSICAATALGFNKDMKNPRVVKAASFGLAFLIILSTMFLKQHSVTDVVAAITMASFICPIVYADEPAKATKLSHQAV